MWGFGTEWLCPAGALRFTLGGPDPSAQVSVERAGGALELLLLAEGPGPSEGRRVR